VLLEMLCAGVPVLVPAGGWLAEQIDSVNQAYLDEIAARCAPPVPLADDGWVPVSAPAGALMLACQWRADAGPGEYLRLEFSAGDATANRTPPAQVILGARTDSLPVRCLLPLPAGCRRMHVTAHNAWRQAPAPATRYEWSLLPEALPMGALGLAFAATDEIPRLLRDLLHHAEHYRSSARAHAGACARAHSGSQVLAGLGIKAVAEIAAPRATT
jgi:hypothetical protein